MAKKKLTLGDVKTGTKFITDSGMKGFLVEKSIGSATVLVYEVPKRREFYKADGTPDTYWTGKLRWGIEVEIEVIE